MACGTRVWRSAPPRRTTPRAPRPTRAGGLPRADPLTHRAAAWQRRPGGGGAMRVRVVGRDGRPASALASAHSTATSWRAHLRLVLAACGCCVICSLLAVGSLAVGSRHSRRRGNHCPLLAEATHAGLGAHHCDKRGEADCVLTAAGEPSVLTWSAQHRNHSGASPTYSPGPWS